LLSDGHFRALKETSMTLRDRILAVFRGQRPDVVPYMLDLSHWFYHRHGLRWDISTTYEEPERALIDYHKQMGVGFYMPNLAGFHAAEYPADVSVTVEKRGTPAIPEIAWRIATPLGAIQRVRTWNQQTYSWGIRQWGIQNEQDLRVFAYAMRSRCFRPHWDRYRQWVDYVGDSGVVYMSLGYSAVGHLLNYWMGIEGFVYATCDFPDALHEAIDSVNHNTLELVDLLCQSPAEVIIAGDNFSSDVQPPSFFNTWSRPYYVEAIRRLHAAGKYVAVHIDGRLRRAIGMIRDAGADCADAVTPTPTGDLTAAECRAEAGEQFILSGGVAPNVWLPDVPEEQFAGHVRAWLAQKDCTFRFIANAGDQVPPGAAESRIGLMRELVEQYGRYDVGPR
jgi:hypothetical protein